MKDLVTFKGNREGLVAILDPYCDFSSVITRLEEKLADASRFLDETEISVDIGSRDLQRDELESLKRVLAAYRLHLRRILAGPGSGEQEVKDMASGKAQLLRSRKKKRRERGPVVAETASEESLEERPGVRPGDEGDGPGFQEKEEIPVACYSSIPASREDIISSEETILVQRTIRSGQRVYYHGNVVVLGDVNPGGEVIAGGNIIVMGSFRGIAHAGAHGNEKAVVAALRLEPAQLRIAGFITRAPDGDFSLPQQPEIARVQDGMVIIERYWPGSERFISGHGKGGA